MRIDKNGVTLIKAGLEIEKYKWDKLREKARINKRNLTDELREAIDNHIEEN